MSAILACLDRRGANIAPGPVAAMLNASSARAVDGQEVWLEGSVALAHQHFWVTPEEVSERQPLISEDRSRVLSADVRIDNRAALLAELGDEASQSSQSSTDAELILLAYQRWGSACVDHLLGDFAFVLWDSRQRRLFAARDAMGARGLCYFANARIVLVASEIKQLLAHPEVPRQLNEGKIADFLVDAWDEHQESLYRDVYYCPPGHWIEASAEGVRCESYWRLDPAKRVRYRHDKDYAEHFREVASAAVRCRLRVAGRVGISLSGGLDSTTVAALAVESGRTRGELRAYSYVFDELADCDERRYIKPFAKPLQLATSYLPADHLWPLSDLETWPGDLGFIFGDPYARLALAVRDAASADGCRALLTGHFGDMLFLGGAYWAAESMRDGRWPRLLETAWKARSDLRPRTDLLSHGLLQLLPGARWSRWRQAQQRGQTGFPMLADGFVDRTELADRLQRDQGWRIYSGPGQWARHRSLTAAAGPQGFMAARGLFTSHGIERLDPLADRRLVELAMALPADQLGRPGRSRWVLRNAMQGVVPSAVRERRDKTAFQSLFFKGVCEQESGTARKLLQAPEIVERGIVRAGWLEQQLQSPKAWEDAGHELWKCVSLELWLRQYG